jgi:dTDP-4-amino-4,6-dideoxygalactose transaminase
MKKLAINGGPKIRSTKFPSCNVIGKDEAEVVEGVMKTGVLSRFLGAWHEDFYGGPEVRALEDEWAKFYDVKYAVAVNSATSGLYCAVGALGIGPGDEVIVSPYTMSASSIAPLIYNAIPVFADIEEDYFCLSPESIEKKITPRTRAIIVVDIFGQSYNAEVINDIAKKYNLKIIEDCAQSPGALFKGKFAGTLGDIGVFSLNYHKHIHCGEGGVIVTNDDETAEKLRLIRNHAEAVIEGKGYSTLVNMLGFNYRMTELEASIARIQLKKLLPLIDKRIKNVQYFEQQLKKIPCIEAAKVRERSKHVFYVHLLKYKIEEIGIHRNTFVEAVKAELTPIESRESEGVKIGAGYVKPLYLQPLYQNRIAYGNNGCPWKCNDGSVSYERGTCPVAERMYNDILITHEMIYPALHESDMDDVISAFEKVWVNRKELKKDV